MLSLMSKITVVYNKIKGPLKYLNRKNKKIILEAKLKGQVNLTLPLLINQSQRVKSWAEVIIMWINKGIPGGPTFKVALAKICKEIGSILPEQEIINCNAKFIHKQLLKHRTEALQRHVAIANRWALKYYHEQLKKKIYRTPLEYYLQLFNQIPSEIKYLKPKSFSKRIKKMEWEFKPED